MKCYVQFGLLVGSLLIPIILSKYCVVKTTKQVRYTTSCGLFGWSRCTRHRTVTHYVKKCCPGWIGAGCSKAICRGRSDTEACNKYFPNSHIVLPDKTVVKKSIGKCIQPNTCECTQVGFYSAGSFCDICSPINNCDLEYCTTKYNQRCRRCEGMAGYEVGKQAYIKSSDTRKCNKACSWRSDSSRCYPGTCSGGLYCNCRCSDGFTGNHCDTITADPDILYNQVTLTADNGETVDAPGDVNRGSPQPLTWTNMMEPTKLYFSFISNYKEPNPSRPLYIQDYKVGVIEGTIRFTKYSQNGLIIDQEFHCSTKDVYHPNQGVFDCSKTTLFSIPLPFQHLERLSFTITSTIGGFVKVRDFENDVTKTYFYKKNSLVRFFDIKFDNVQPYHCQPVNNCKQTMLTDIDITNKAENTVYWNGWNDDDSKIDFYDIEVFSTKPGDDELIMYVRIFDTKSTLNSQQFTLTQPGVYVVLFAAVDKAGNHRTARRCLIFDDKHHVLTVTDTNLRVTSAVPSTRYTWQQNRGPVDIDWNDRYINVKHHNGKYLAGIQSYHGVTTDYDDNYGKRTTQPIENVQGIVRYETYYGIDSERGSSIQPTDNDFTSTGNLNQSRTISPTIQDGDTLKYYIRAYDIVDFYLEESVTVYFDSSPPVIRDLWLTKGDDLNIAVHGFEDFDKLVIEWIAYDLHSGLETVEWKLFDNSTDDVILHGSQHIPPQGETGTLLGCEQKYQTYSRGSDCYCTPVVGCYHQHFQVKPLKSLIDKQGLIEGKDLGVHDHDYYIEVNVMNNAKLSTTLTYKITIDLSSPHVGVVHDGKYGEPEVDYQPDRILDAHWEGFFDKESGVRYYQYGFSTKCLTADQFHFNIQNTSGINETVVTHVNWLAPTDGQYYITVVAYNRALEPSQPVCSDGVIIDSTPPDKP